MSADSTGGPAAATRAATRFFWGWLLAATAMSVAGNVTHATMSAPRGTVALAAAAAVVPPAVLVGATHSVALLIKASRLGLTYWCALAMTVALAGCAFVLSFDALRDLAISLGFQRDRAWLWPVAIDVSIAQSTLALLTLAPVTRQQDAPACPAGSPAAQPERGTVGEQPWPPEHPARPVPRSPTDVPSRISSPAVCAAVPGRGPEVPELVAAPGASGDGEHPARDPAAISRWKATADQLVREGVTSKDPAVVAAILAEHAAGTPPSTIGRRQNVHHTTVGRILSAAQGVAL